MCRRRQNIAMQTKKVGTQAEDNATKKITRGNMISPSESVCPVEESNDKNDKYLGF
jgi:hypothetical protein